MRVESSVISLSWIPSEAIPGAMRVPFDLGVAHYDAPPPEEVTDPGPIVEGNQARFANHLRAFIDVEDGRITGHGHLGRSHISQTHARLGVATLVFNPVALPEVRPEPVVTETSVRFQQTVGGRTGAPMPRRMRRPPYVTVVPPLVWTTLALTINADGTNSSEIVSASQFPRHWFYDGHGQLFAKSGLADFAKWAQEPVPHATPWGLEDSAPVVTAVESALERQLSGIVMQGAGRPRIAKLAPGKTLVEQGEAGDDVFLLLDGVLSVEVDGKPLVDVGPGAVLGERAMLEGGRRTATLRAATPCKVAQVPARTLTEEARTELARSHRREAGSEAGAGGGPA